MSAAKMIILQLLKYCDYAIAFGPLVFTIMTTTDGPRYSPEIDTNLNSCT